MSTHNICFRGEIIKICGYPLLSVAMYLNVLDSQNLSYFPYYMVKLPWFT